MSEANTQLVLSLFPGIGLLDMAFEEEGFCVVRGPDLLWGGDVKRFHPPQGGFDGIIGGPPCQFASDMVHMVRAVWGDSAIAENLIPEYERCVAEARPDWFLMENVPKAPEPKIESYTVKSVILNNRWVGGEQHRERRFSFGMRGHSSIDLNRHIEVSALEAFEWESPVLARQTQYIRFDRGGKLKASASKRKQRRTLNDCLRLQGLPESYFEHSPFTVEWQRRMVGNGVPLPMGRAIAKAVRQAISLCGEKVA